MYFDSNLLSLRKKGRLSAVWLAATNKTLFRRHIKRGECDSINIHDLCTSILDCADTHQPLIMVAKLAYGAVFIYQQQVQFLYDKVSHTACKQSAAFQHLKNSQGEVSQAFSNKCSNKITKEFRYEDVLTGPSISTEAVITELLANAQHTSVLRVDDITLHELESVSLNVTIEATLQRDQLQGFGEMQLKDYYDFLRNVPINSSSVGYTKEDFGIVKDIIDITNEPIPVLRNASVSETEPPAIPIAEIPIACLSVACIDTDPMKGIESPSIATLPAIDERIAEEKNLAIESIISDNRLITEPHQSPTDATQVAAETLNLKRKLPSKMIFDKKTKLDSEIIQRAIQNFTGTMRCLNPRCDSVPTRKFRYALDDSISILQHPVRHTRSSVLPQLFLRNMRKRTTEVDDVLCSIWGHELLKAKKAKKSIDKSNRGSMIVPPVENDLQSTKIVPIELNTIGTSPEENMNTRHRRYYDREASKKARQDQDPVEEQKIDGFNENSLCNLLEKLWSNQKDRDVSMKSLEDFFSSRLDGASCFSTLLDFL
ncbi:uncharacterized protein LOC129749284 isoform X2 [Uranotaenia lowii]|uniref:uncharacterized protein LOC129749284 isoform X2 n=1 Tax=Uranotaenia lowii TaxID=190385 RepID=UPI00247A37FF|nr:uncharacterized protein LOC129749284 isoform X2 [Uranotaenia lowii]